MADISKINGYDIKDKVAREELVKKANVDDLSQVSISGDYNDLENKPCYETICEKNIVLTYENCTETLDFGAYYSLKKACIDISQYTIDELLDRLISCRVINMVGDERILSKEEIREFTFPVNDDLYMLCEEFGLICFKETLMEEVRIPAGLWLVYMPEVSMEFDFVDKITKIEQLDEKFIPDTIARVSELPCYDTRVFEDCTIEYDGIEEGKDEGYQQAGYRKNYYLKVSDLVVSDTEFNSYVEALTEGYIATSPEGELLSETYVYNDGSIIHTDLNVLFVKEPIDTVSGMTGYYFPSAGIYFNIGYTVKFSFKKPSGEFKVLDEKFLVNTPGKKMIVGEEFTDVYTESTYIVQTNAEVFNDYKKNVATGAYSHAEGRSTSAYGDYSHAEGDISRAYGLGSHAEGEQTKARGEYSHTEGSFTEADGECAHAEGMHSHASGNSSHAEGNGSMAYGDYSHAEGYGFTYGKYSHAEGCFTEARGYAQHVQGQCNIIDEEEKYAHIVGNGAHSGARSNAHTLDWNGNAWFAGNVSVGADNKQLATEEFVINNSSIKPIPDTVTTGLDLYNLDPGFYRVTNNIFFDHSENFYGYNGTSTLELFEGYVIEICEKQDNEFQIICYSSCMYGWVGSDGKIWRSGTLNEGYIGSWVNNLNAEDMNGNIPPTSDALKQYVNEKVENALLKTEQVLTDDEKNQVRENLGFIGKTAVVGETVVVDGTTYTVEENAEIVGDYANNKAIGAWSLAEGSENIAVGRASHVEGAMNKAIGTGSHVEGIQCTATGFWSHAEGERTKVTSYASHAEGSYTTLPDGTTSYGTASGYASHVEGGGCYATGSCAHVEGGGCRANGACSHAEGRYTVASGSAQHVEGVANIEDKENKYIHIAGNGTWEQGVTNPTRSNAYTLDWSGNAWYAGNVSVGADNKQLATEEFVNNIIANLPKGDDKFKITVLSSDWVYNEGQFELTVIHNLNSEDLGLFVRDVANNCEVFVDYRVIDANTIKIINDEILDCVVKIISF